jgi:hypothetical protein
MDSIDHKINKHLLSKGIDVQSVLNEMIEDGYITLDLGDLSHGCGEKVPGSDRTHKD